MSPGPADSRLERTLSISRLQPNSNKRVHSSQGLVPRRTRIAMKCSDLAESTIYLNGWAQEHWTLIAKEKATHIFSSNRTLQFTPSHCGLTVSRRSKVNTQAAPKAAAEVAPPPLQYALVCLPKQLERAMISGSLVGPHAFSLCFRVSLMLYFKPNSRSNYSKDS